MKKRVKFLVFLLLSSARIYSQSWDWAVREGMGTHEDNGRAICNDGSGFIYVAADSAWTAAGKIYKYSYSGNKIWSTTVGRHLDAIAYDNAGFIYVAGDSIAKLDTSGNRIWAKQYSNTVRDLVLDSRGFIYSTSWNSVVEKMDTSGNLIWSIGGKAWGNGICMDSSMNLYVTGFFRDTMTLCSQTYVPRWPSDIFFAKFDSSGNCLWTKIVGTSHYQLMQLYPYPSKGEIGNDVITDKNGHVYFTGSFADTCFFDTQMLVTDSIMDNVFLAKYDTSGNLIWVRQDGGRSDDEGRSLAIDNANNIIVGGSYIAWQTTFGGNNVNGWGNWDAFIAAYDSMGNFLSIVKAGGAQWNEITYGITADNAGNIFATGSFCDTSYFGPYSLVAAGNGYIYDIFIGKINLAVGIDKITVSAFPFSIFPNPTLSNSQITFTYPAKGMAREIVVNDINGKEMARYALPPWSKTQKIKLPELAAGVYVARMADGSAIAKFVVE